MDAAHRNLADQCAIAATGTAAAAGAQLPPMDKVGILGHAVWLMTQSPAHKHQFIQDLEWLVMPALLLGQFRIWHQKNEQGATVPVGFATWAYLDESAEKRIQEGIKKLTPQDWKSGDNLWLMDLILPFGGQEAAVKELREQVFPGRTIKSLQPAPDGSGKMAVVEW